MSKFLDLNGLTTYDGKIKQYIQDNSSGGDSDLNTRMSVVASPDWENIEFALKDYVVQGDFDVIEGSITVYWEDMNNDPTQPGARYYNTNATNYGNQGFDFEFNKLNFVYQKSPNFGGQLSRQATLSIGVQTDLVGGEPTINYFSENVLNNNDLGNVTFENLGMGIALIWSKGYKNVLKTFDYI